LAGRSGAYAFSFENASVAWGHVAVFGLYIFQFGFEFGLGTISWIFLSELFPRYVRSAATSIAVAILFMFNSLVSLYYPSLRDTISLEGCFLVFSAFGLLGAVIIYLYGPETRGMDFEGV
jgi:hypothetical protein